MLQHARPGRPRLSIDATRLRELARLGLNASQIASRLGISRRTFFNRLEQDEDLREALDAGIAETIEEAAKTLYDLAVMDRNVAALQFLLKTKGGFNVPRGPAVEVRIDSRDDSLRSFDLSHVRELAARQSALLDEPDLEAAD